MARPARALLRTFARPGAPGDRRPAARARRAQRRQPRGGGGPGPDRAFFPHGLGHMLGIFTHDVAGKQATGRHAGGDPSKEQISAHQPHPRRRQFGDHRARHLLIECCWRRIGRGAGGSLRLGPDRPDGALRRHQGRGRHPRDQQRVAEYHARVFSLACGGAAACGWICRYPFWHPALKLGG